MNTLVITSKAPISYNVVNPSGVVIGTMVQDNLLYNLPWVVTFGTTVKRFKYYKDAAPYARNYVPDSNGN